MTAQPYEMASYELADVGTRFAALFIDGLVLCLIEGAGFAAAREPGLGVGFIVGLAYSWFFWTRNKGQTPGKMLMKIRVIKVDGSSISDADAVIRYIGYTVNSILFIGWLWALFDEKSQGLHDKMARTYVVKAE